MRIENNPIPGFRPKQAGEAASPGETARASEVTAGSVADASTHAPSPELQQLLSLLRQVPEVRPEVVEQARQQLASGELLTEEAALQTARALIQAGEP